MINIHQINDNIVIQGHSLPQICAAVSSVLYTTVNAVLKHEELGIESGQCTFEDNLEDDFFSIKVAKPGSDKIGFDDFVDLMIENMFDMFYDIQEQDKSNSIIITRMTKQKKTA